MPLPNRVDPWGNISSNSARGALLGNRGILHNKCKQIIKSYQHQNWVTCRLKYKGRRRALMMPGNYTELFFLDEATAFAAGHRPCGECRRERYLEFKRLWVEANLNKPPDKVKIAEINKIMHQERVRRGTKLTFKSSLKSLPDGSFFSFGQSAFLVLQKSFYKWSFAGYQTFNFGELPDAVEVLTPKSVIEVFKMGFKPECHESVKVC